SSARDEPRMRKTLENLTSRLTKVGQSTWDTAVRPRAALNALIASRFSERHPDVGMTPGGRSEFAGAETDVPDNVSLFRSSPEVMGPKGSVDLKSPIAETCASKGSATMPLATSRWRRSATPGRFTFV